MTQAKDLSVKKFGSGVIRISGQIYQLTGNLYPSKKCDPMYNQFYIYDGQDAVNQRKASLLYDVTLSARVTKLF